jgi:putative heme-binding domain-containing protein
MRPPPPPYCVPNARKGTKVEVLAGCEKSAGWTADNKRSLVNWFAKAVEWRGGASFTGFLNLMFDTALEVFTDEEKQEAYRRIPSFAPPEKAEAARPDRPGWKRPSVLARQRGVAAVSPQEIFEFQMFDPMTLKAKAPDGRKVFEDECASCHRFGAGGKDFGPDLTTLASRFKKKDILEAVLWPSKVVSDQYQSTIVETSDGGLINGLVVKEDKGTLLIKTGDQERPVEVPVGTIKSRRKSEISIMPDGLLDGYSQDQISALMAFLLAGPK